MAGCAKIESKYCIINSIQSNERSRPRENHRVVLCNKDHIGVGIHFLRQIPT